jgi:hypothetical protein
MKTINVPGFTAERSLEHPNEKYLLSALSESVASATPDNVYPARFACWQGGCACAGDEDCNAMFSVACSSDGYAQCWVRSHGPAGSVFCLCS